MAEEKKKSLAVQVAEVRRHDGPLVMPEKMSIDDAIEVLTRKKKYDDEKVHVDEVMKCFPWDGALALSQAIEEAFGIVMQTTIPTWFGPIHPKMQNVEIAYGKTKQVPWGRFSLPGIKGWIQTMFPTDEEGNILPGFRMYSECTHGDEADVKKLFDRTREIAMGNSIYKGQAFSMRFPRGTVPEPKFLRLTKAEVIFNRDLERAVDANIMTVVKHTEVVRDARIPLKRGILLAGRYGTGKTLTANHIARECVRHGWTFIYVTDVSDLAEALRFAQDYQPAVVFAEDIDRAAGSNRTEDVNELLNTLDGIGNKSDEIMTILTSNHPEHINPAMRRPGRIDVVLAVEPPDSEAAQRLMRLYGGKLIHPEENLQFAGDILEKQIPAVIREAVERAKLECICRSNGEKAQIMGVDLEHAAKTLVAEQKLFAPKPPDMTPLEQVGNGMAMTVAETIERMHRAVGVSDEIKDLVS